MTPGRRFYLREKREQDLGAAYASMPKREDGFRIRAKNLEKILPSRKRVIRSHDPAMHETVREFIAGKNGGPDLRPELEKYGVALIRFLDAANRESLSKASLEQIIKLNGVRGEFMRLWEETTELRAAQIVQTWVNVFKERMDDFEKDAEAEPVKADEFGSFFAPKYVAAAVKRAQTVNDQKRWQAYFRDWGCLLCETQDKGYGGNGMCGNCYSRTRQRLLALR
jgi:hypothetical protein